MDIREDIINLNEVRDGEFVVLENIETNDIYHGKIYITPIYKYRIFLNETIGWSIELW